MKLLRFILLSVTLVSPLSALSVQDKISKGAVGDYILYRQNQLVTLLRLHSNTAQSFIFEEISLPYSEWKKQNVESLSKWVQNGAIGHSSWTLFEISKDNQELLECFSFVREAWLKLEKDSLFLSSLISQTLIEAPKAKRRKVGKAPMHGFIDDRKEWTPPLFIHGKKEESRFDIYNVAWPRDDTPLSGRSLDLYYAEICDTFPAWLQVTSTTRDAYRIQTLDMGKNLNENMREMPRRSPYFTSKISTEEGAFHFTISMPPYFQNFSLRLVSKDQENTPYFPIFTSEIIQEETYQITLKHEDLKSLRKGEYYLEISFAEPSIVTLSHKEYISWY